jgi:hypothetical protein
MTHFIRLALVIAAGLGLTGAAMAQAAKPVACEVRLELSVTKRQLAQALAKCGEACAAPK